MDATQVGAGILVALDDRWACKFVHPLVHEVVLSTEPSSHSPSAARAAKSDNAVSRLQGNLADRLPSPDGPTGFPA